MKLFGWLLGLTLVCSPLYASDNLDNWLCTLDIDVVGDAYAYFKTGHDTWSGPGSWECHKDKMVVSLKVQVDLVGWSPGFGASKDSRMILQAISVPVRYPQALVGNFTVVPAGMNGRSRLRRFLADGPKQDYMFTLWSKDGDEFFGSSGMATMTITVNKDED